MQVHELDHNLDPKISIKNGATSCKKYLQKQPI
jgi:hypothetical protein